MGRRAVALSVLIVCAALVPLPAGAQYNTGSISGIVWDPQRHVVQNARVVATSATTGFTVERRTDAEGRFFLAALPIGTFSLTVDSPGFSAFRRDGLVLELGQSLSVPVTLQIAGLSDTVSVSVPAPVFQTTGGEMSDVISARQVGQLPLNGRQFLQLAQMTDGVAVPPGGTRGAALEQAGSLPAVLGQRSGHNIYLLDGVKVTDEYFNNLVVSPSIDAIQEFKIQKTMYPAEFGGKASALINVVTKSGANTFHGGAREFLRSDRFDARNYFDDPGQRVPPLSQHQFGASVGGPIARDRTFFFGDYEGQRITRSLTQTFSVPSMLLRQGDFSGVAALCDPLTRTTTGACTPFVGNTIPTSRLDPVAVALLHRVPMPTSAGPVQNLLAVGTEQNPMNQMTARIDQRLGSEDMLFGRFTSHDVQDEQPFGTSQLNETLVPGFGRTVTTHGTSLALGVTHVFSNTVLNEMRLGWLRASGGQVSPNQGVSFAPGVGLQGVTTDARDVGYPQVSFGGQFSTIGDPASFVSRDDRSVELYDNVLWDRGAHRLKFGGYLFHLRFNPVNPQGARGLFTFTGQWSGNAFADFLLGYPSSGQVGIGRADEHGRSTWLHVYGQDEWRMAPNLTLNYGLRYEINGQMTDEDNRLSAIDLNVPGGRFVIASDDNGRISPSAAPLLGQIPVPYVSSADAGWTSALLRPSYLRFAPRVGVTWAVGNDARTVVSAGYGVFLNQWAYSVQQSLAQTLPFFFAKTVNEPADAARPTYSTGTMLLAPANGTIGGSTMNHDFQTEYAKNWNVVVQRQLTRGTAVEVSYLHSAIVGADSSTVINVPEPGPGPIGSRRPVPALSNVTAIRWDGYSIFDAMTLKAERRLTSGLSFSTSYTLSRAVDDASDPGPTTYETNLPQDVRNMAAERAPASFDHRHRVVGSVTYAPPPFFGGSAGWRAALGTGWRLHAIGIAQSGAPFTVNLGTDRANVGSGPAQRPDATCDANVGGAQTAAQWFNTSCFSLPAPYTFGNASRNTVLAPGYANIDAALVKDLIAGSDARIELRLEIFNLLNRTNFDVPNRIAFTPNFGRIFSAGPARQMQFGIKLVF
jgi:hypothetical protein